jgi:hypothetical protein
MFFAKSSNTISTCIWNFYFNQIQPKVHKSDMCTFEKWNESKNSKTTSFWQTLFIVVINYMWLSMGKPSQSHFFQILFILMTLSAIFRHFWIYFFTLGWIKCIRGASLLTKPFFFYFSPEFCLVTLAGFSYRRSHMLQAVILRCNCYIFVNHAGIMWAWILINLPIIKLLQENCFSELCLLRNVGMDPTPLLNSSGTNAAPHCPIFYQIFFILLWPIFRATSCIFRKFA